MLEDGTQLGPYKVLGVIGVGGMGEVYQAHDPRLNRKVAIKVLQDEFASDMNRMKRFQREVQIVGGLNHPNLVTVYDADINLSKPYLVMELLDGETLRQKINRSPISLKNSIEIAQAVSEGLSAAHCQGVIHRDLKPENIFLTKQGQVKILDFGLAKLPQLPKGYIDSRTTTVDIVLEEHRTESGTLVGTVAYMSPEQVRGEAVDNRSDIFSLGIILWEMVTGCRPFNGTSTIEIMNSILKDEPLNLNPGLNIPPVLRRILGACLSKMPSQRFHSAHDLAFALSQVTDPLVANEPQYSLTATRPWGQRHYKFLVVGFAIVVLFIVGAWRSRPSVTHVQRLLPSARIISSAKFLQDGRAIVYTSTPGGNNSFWLGELFRLDPGKPPRSLGVKDCRILDVSPSGNLLLLRMVKLNPDSESDSIPVLAEMSSNGGTTPKMLLKENLSVYDRARWVNNGPDFVIKFWQFKGKPTQVIMHNGRVLYKLPHGYGLGDFIVSKNNESILFTEHRSNGNALVTIALDGSELNRTSISQGEHRLFLMNDRLLSMNIRSDWNDPVQLLSMSPNTGNERVVRSFPVDSQVWDVSLNGELLITPGVSTTYRELRWLKPGSDREISIDLGRKPRFPALNGSGSQLSGTVSFAGHEKAFVLEAEDNNPQDYGDGFFLDQSSDGNTFLEMTGNIDGYYHLRLRPKGAGKPINLPGYWISAEDSYILDSSRVLVLGRSKVTPELDQQLYILDSNAEKAHSIALSDASAIGPPSPDGRFIFALLKKGENSNSWNILNIETSKPTPIPISCNGMTPCGWTADGGEIWLTRSTNKEGTFPLEVWRCNLKTGKIIKSRDIDGSLDYPLAKIERFRISPNGESYVYTSAYEPPVWRELFRLSGLN